MKKVLTALTLIGITMSSAMAQVTIPDTGVDVSGYITAGITTLAGIVATALGGYVAFLLIKKACRWIGRALS